MSDQPGRHTGPDSSRHGEHEPGPGTVPAAELLAGLRGGRGSSGGDEDPRGTADPESGAESGDPDHGDRATDPSPTGPSAPPAPVLVADGLGLHTGHGWAFRDVTLEVPPATVTAIVGPAGSGRSSLLLALTGRMRITDGTLAVAGRSAIADPRAARQRAAVARIADLITPEERLTVEESVTERCLIDGVRAVRGRDAFRRACGHMAVTFDGAVLVEELAPHRQTMLALALAAIRRADVIVLDDTDRGTTTDGEREIYRAAAALAASGPAIITTTTRREAVGAEVTAVPIAGSPEEPVTAEQPAEPSVTAGQPSEPPTTATTEDER